jgi:hypothetical protein
MILSPTVFTFFEKGGLAAGKSHGECSDGSPHSSDCIAGGHVWWFQEIF